MIDKGDGFIVPIQLTVYLMQTPSALVHLETRSFPAVYEASDSFSTRAVQSEYEKLGADSFTTKKQAAPAHGRKASIIAGAFGTKVVETLKQFQVCAFI